MHLAPLRRARGLWLPALLRWPARSPACAKVPEAGLVAFGRVWTGNPGAAVGRRRRHAGRHHPGRGRQRRRGALRRQGDGGRLRRGGHGRARVHGRAHPLPRRRIPAGERGPADAPTRPEEFTARIKAFAAERKPGDWILGGDWDHERWPGGAAADQGAGSTPSRRTTRSSSTGSTGTWRVANSAALRAAGVTRATKDVPGGEIVRRPGTGEPTGVLKDNAMMLVVRRDAGADRAAAGRRAGPRAGLRRQQGRHRRQLHERAGQPGSAPQRPRPAPYRRQDVPRAALGDTPAHSTT